MPAVACMPLLDGLLPLPECGSRGLTEFLNGGLTAHIRFGCVYQSTELKQPTSPQFECCTKLLIMTRSKPTA